MTRYDTRVDTRRSCCSMSVALSSGESNSGISSSVEGIANTVGDLSVAIYSLMPGEKDLSSGKRAGDDLLLSMLLTSGDSCIPTNFGLLSSSGYGDYDLAESCITEIYSACSTIEGTSMALTFFFYL